ncbi:RING finger protein 214 [Astyanax mexicanus]|uniref:RING finger protein 214 n=1 Tax=Astyanax mexicanus TaxID=7994 RepID=A0A8T2MDL2_ASTMX|nr:RING finger protein 214 [Astyanax mexicanus]
MESDLQTDWSFSLEGGSVAGAVPVCASLWAVPAPATLWSVPGLLQSQAPLPEQEALFLGHEPDIMPVTTETKELDIQTENWTEDKASNTNDDWESVMHKINEYGSRLAQQYESMVRQEEADETEHSLHIKSLEKTKEEKQRLYQGLISKIESLQVKLDLNSSKTTRKNFTVKLEELTAEKERLAEGKKRLVQELEEADRKLKQLIEEQNNDKLSWEQEIADLQTENERLSKQLEETNQIALKDEIAALESQRELAISQIEDWIAEAERYLDTLRLDPSHQNARQRHEWEKNIMVVRNSLSRLQNMYSDNIILLQSGQQLDSLPPISLPHLPNVPSIDLFVSALRNSVSQMPFYSGPMTRVPPPTTLPDFHPGSVPVHRLTPPLPPVSSQSFPLSTVNVPSYSAGPKPSLTMPIVLPPLPPFRMPPMTAMPTMPLPHTQPMFRLPHTFVPTSTYGAAGPAHVSMVTTHAAAPMPTTQATPLPAHTSTSAPAPPAAAAAAVSALPQGTFPATSARNSSPQTVSSNPPPAGKLDKLLERLGTQFPQCTRTQLMGVLQQIKSERGTMAGLSMDEVTQQVSQKLAQNDRPAPGPIAPPSGSRSFAAAPGPVQRPSVQPHLIRPPLRAPGAPGFQPRPSQPPAMRKLCLMCQNHVEPGTQYNTNCPHTLHKDCISVWLQSSKNHSCPFCPSK